MSELQQLELVRDKRLASVRDAMNEIVIIVSKPKAVPYVENINNEWRPVPYLANTLNRLWEAIHRVDEINEHIYRTGILIKEINP